MTEDAVRHITMICLLDWARILTDNHSTPFLLVGIGHDHRCGELQVCVCKQTTTADAVLMLREVVRILEERGTAK
jgi:hypothetical protein